MEAQACQHLPQANHTPENLSTAVKVRWMGEAVPGRVVNSSRQRPSSSGLAVGACTHAW